MCYPYLRMDIRERQTDRQKILGGCQWGGTANGYHVSFRDHGNVLDFNNGDNCATSNILKTTTLL